MPLIIFNNIKEKDKTETVKKLLIQSTPNQEFFFMIILAVAMATFGLLLNNSAIIIGSMLISPILYSFLSLSLGLSISDPKIILRSILSIVKSLTIGIATATLITLFFSKEIAPEIIAQTTPSLAYGAVAFIAGFAAAFSVAKPQLNETFSGIAIAVALIPPIAVIGIGIAKFDWIIIRESLLLFVLNTIAIFAGSIIVFSLMNFFAKKNIAESTIKNEDRKIKEIKEKVESEKALEREELKNT